MYDIHIVALGGEYAYYLGTSTTTGVGDDAVSRYWYSTGTVYTVPAWYTGVTVLKVRD